MRQMRTGKSGKVELVTEHGRQLQITIHGDGQRLKPICHIGCLALDRHSDVVDLGLARSADLCHHAEADERHRDSLDAGHAGRIESATYDDIQRFLEVIDDEDHAIEEAEVRTPRRRNDRLRVTIACEGIGSLIVKLVAGGAHEESVDSAEPHTTRVDSSDDGIGRNMHDVAVEHVDVHEDILPIKYRTGCPHSVLNQDTNTRQ